MLENFLNFFYESYIGIFIFIALFFLFAYLLTKNRQKLKKMESLLNEKDKELGEFRDYIDELDTKWIEREHECEKSEILFNQRIKELEAQKKEGLKNQVVMKIEEYQNRRTSQLKRVNLIKS